MKPKTPSSLPLSRMEREIEGGRGWGDAETRRPSPQGIFGRRAISATRVPGCKHGSSSGDKGLSSVSLGLKLWHVTPFTMPLFVRRFRRMPALWPARMGGPLIEKGPKSLVVKRKTT